LPLSPREERAGRESELLDTTTTPVVDPLAPRWRSGERDRERGVHGTPPVQGNAALSPLVLSGEREWGASDMVGRRCARVGERGIDKKRLLSPALLLF